jgi:hypothetical protein
MQLTAGGKMQRRCRSFLAAAKNIIAVIGMMLTLICCSTPWEPDTDGNAVACRSTYNFEPGTPEFDQCMQRFKEIDARKGNRSLR